MVGVLREQHADHLVLSDGSRIPLAAGLSVEQFGAGTRVTITYSRESGGEMIVQSITRSGVQTPGPGSLL
jgi:hypothetical protein